MGMFDRIWITCPNCQKDVEFKSKAGECVLHDYNELTITPGIADDIKNDAEMCENCGELVKLHVRLTSCVEAYIE